LSTWQILTGDAIAQLATLADGSVQTCVTSPPYWGLRDYGHVGQIGLEPTPEAFVAALVATFAAVKRVLAADGTLWLNLGDSYVNAKGESGGQDEKQQARRFGVRPQDGAPPSGLKRKDLVGIPWRVAFALQADGWYLRQDIIWHKPNPMPESVTDRCTKAHEYLFLLSKAPRYYFDAEAMQEPGVYPAGTMGAKGSVTRSKTPFVNGRLPEYKEYNGQRNKRSVWTVNTQPYAGAHFATFPEKLIEPCILAGSKPGDLVLDPFCGSGTTGAVALRHQRNFVGVELNPEYVKLARLRIGAVAPLFAEEQSA
jgi:DNA modification methylase